MLFSAVMGLLSARTHEVCSYWVLVAELVLLQIGHGLLSETIGAFASGCVCTRGFCSGMVDLRVMHFKFGVHGVGSSEVAMLCHVYFFSFCRGQLWRLRRPLARYAELDWCYHIQLCGLLLVCLGCVEIVPIAHQGLYVVRRRVLQEPQRVAID